MVSIKVRFRLPEATEVLGTVFYQVIHLRATSRISTDIRLQSSEWDEAHHVISATGASTERRAELQSFQKRIKCDVARLARIADKLEESGLSFSAGDVVEEFRRQCREHTLFAYMTRIIGQLRQSNRRRTSETYLSALRSLQKWRRGKDMMLDELDGATMARYEAWLMGRGVVTNTVSFYMRIIRATYNRAVEEDVCADRKPFRRVYTGIDKTVKRAIPMATIQRINLLELSRKPSMDHARDLFMLSFMLRGISFVDMAFLRKTDLKGGHITYRRRKTGQLLTIGWTERMQQIVDKYPGNPQSPYLLPILSGNEHDSFTAYRRIGARVNFNLKKIGNMVNCSTPLTLYVARHSWASIARTKGIPLNTISLGLGHESESTTRIYLASIDNTAIDRANARILSGL